MLGSAAVDGLLRGLSIISSDSTKGKNKFTEALKFIAAHPIKVLAAYIFAPILIIKIALTVKNPLRRTIAVSGFIIAIILSYTSATFLGSLVGSFFIGTHFGFLAGIGFLFGTAVSVFLSVVFCVFVFNSISFIFLRMSSQDVVDYLDEISS